MEIVLATNGLVGIGGSETYLLTVAEHLQRLGHEVTVHAAEGGAMSELMRSRGLRVAIGEAALPEACDAILVQDAGMAYALADRWPGTPQVFRAPSAYHDFQSPPLLPGVVAVVVVCSDRIARHLEALAGERELVRLRHPIDTKRLSPLTAIRERPLRAVLLGNYASRGRLELLVEAWGEAGVECVTVGAHGVTSTDPAPEIGAADIVVGKSRAILDGMACGRAAYVLDFPGGDGWVTEASYPAMEADNFGGQATDWVIDRDRLVADLGAYRAEMGQVNRDLVLAHHDARTHAYELVSLFRRLNGAEAPVGPLRELARLVRLQWSTEQDAMGLRERAVIAETYARSLEEDRERLRAQIAELSEPVAAPRRRWR
jgi:hypothetical protein